MSIEMTVSEIAEVLGLSRQAINNRVKELPEEDTDKNDKGVTVVTRSGLIKPLRVTTVTPLSFFFVSSSGSSLTRLLIA